MAHANNTVLHGNFEQYISYVFYFFEDTDTEIGIVSENSSDPFYVTIPGTTSDAGLATVVFINGSDSRTVAASIVSADEGQITCYIASVSMPTDTTGIENAELPADGKWHAFSRFNRFYFVPAAHWYRVQLSSAVDQFTCFQMQQKAAEVFILNKTKSPLQLIYTIGDIAKAQVTITKIESQIHSYSLQGNGTQYVLFNADSAVDPNNAKKIVLQSLSGLYSAFNEAAAK